MLLFNFTPSPDIPGFFMPYELISATGMAHSAIMCGEHFDFDKSFDKGVNRTCTKNFHRRID